MQEVVACFNYSILCLCYNISVKIGKEDRQSIIRVIAITAGVVVLLQIVVSILFLIWCFVSVKSSNTVNTSVVRNEFAKTALSNSAYFEVEEIEEKAKDDRIYLRVGGIEEDVSYVCRSSSLSKYCWVQVGGGETSGGVDLGGYYWRLHAVEISELLEQKQYERNLAGPSLPIEVYNNDVEAATNFVQDLLEIPDIRRLYDAYKAEVRRTNEMRARVAFGEDYYLDFYNGHTGDRERHGLFEWAAEQGL